MTVCRFCDHDNPPDAERCESCGGPLPVEEGAIPSPRDVNPSAARASPDDQVLELLHNGRKIEAIKVYREQHGVGLKEAKDAVEAIAHQNNIAQRRSGCAGVVLVVLVIAWALA